jgi:hypothetical protein
VPGGGSAALSGGAYLSTPHAGAFALGTSDVALETWVRFSALSGVHYVFGKAASPTIGEYIGVSVDASGTLYGLGTASAGAAWDMVMASSSGVVTTGTPLYLAMTRSGSAWALYCHGTRVATAMSSISVGVGSSAVTLGGHGGGATMTGIFAASRLTIGTARGLTGATIPVPTELWPSF